MLTVTENARTVLKEILENAEAQPEQSLRLIEEEGNYGLALDTKQEGDQVVEHEGTTVLLVGAEIKTELEDIVLDLQDTPGGPRLAFVPKEEA
jgi:Fe-S cluster assembly iron-binding protein IscA